MGKNVPIVTGLWRGGPVLNLVVNDYPRALLLVKIFSLFLYFSSWLSWVFFGAHHPSLDAQSWATVLLGLVL